MSMTQHERVAELEAEIAALRKQVTGLLKRMRELEARLSKGSHDNGKPLPTHGLKRQPPLTRSRRRTSGKQIGGRVGHLSETRHIVTKPDAEVDHRSIMRMALHTPLEEMTEVVRPGCRQIQDLPPLRLAAAERQTLRTRNPACQGINAGATTSETPSRARCGPRLRGLAVYLVKQQLLSNIVRLANQAGRVRTDSLVRNSIYIMAITVFTGGLGYLYWMVATHLYPPKSIGLASAIISAMSITMLVSSAGIGKALVQVLPQRRDGSEWSLALNAGLSVGVLASILIALPAVVIMQLVLRLDFGDQQTIYITMFICSVPLWTLATLLDQVFIAERRAGKALARNAAFAALKIPLLAVPFFWAWEGAIAIFDTWIISTTVSLILGAALLLHLRRNYRPVMRGIVKQARSMLSAFTGHHLIEIGGQMPVYVLPLLVTARLSAAANAYFYPALMTGAVFFMVSTSVATSLFAEGSYTPRDFAHKLRSSALMIAILMFPAMLIVYVCRYYILSLFGPSYAQHGEVLLTLLIISAVPDAITNIYIAWLRVRRHLRDAALLNLGMSFLAFILAWILLPDVGIAGAGWAWLIAEMAGSAIAGVHFIVSRNVRRFEGQANIAEHASRQATQTGQRVY